MGSWNNRALRAETDKSCRAASILVTHVFVGASSWLVAACLHLHARACTGLHAGTGTMEHQAQAGVRHLCMRLALHLCTQTLVVALCGLYA